jgi:oligopeptide transport system substrate-binding protein
MFLSILFSGCHKSSSAPLQVLRVNLGIDPTNLDPRKARDLNAATICRMLFEGLMRIGQSGRPELALAEKVEISSDGLTYTFFLKKAHWSDGTVVTSFDVANTWKTILDPAFPTDIAYQLYLIKNGKQVKAGELTQDKLGVRTPNAEMLIVELEQPTPYFLEACSMSSYLPVPPSLKESFGTDPSAHVGNGPFLLASWVHNDEIRLVKSHTYWEEKSVALEEIALLMLSPDTEMRLFEEKKLDWAGSPLSTIPRDALEHLKQTDQLKASPLSGTYFLRVNTQETMGDRKNILAHAGIRRALAMSIDRSGITTHILQGGQSPAYSLVPPDMGLLGDGYFAEGDLAAARALLDNSLQELGLTRETSPPLVISFNQALPYTMPVVQAIQQQWESALGLKVELNIVEPKVYYAQVKEKKFQLAIGSWVADFYDPINFLEVFKFKHSNHTSWESPKYIDLLNQSQICVGLTERSKLLREAEQLLMQEMPLIPIFHFAMNYLQQETVKGIALSPIGQIDFRWAELQ